MCGIVCYAGAPDLPSEDGLVTSKRAGKLVRPTAPLDAEPLPPSVTGIGHTRWATHGGPTDANAHPHLAGHGSVALIHNGIIENFAALLLAAAYGEHGDLSEAMRAVARRLQGAFTLLAVHADQPGVVVGARRN